jgi:zinc transporter ZupT
MTVQAAAAVAPVVVLKKIPIGLQEVLLSIANVFSGGIMLGTALSHLLPEAVREGAGHLPDWLPNALAGLAFFVSWWVFGLLLPKMMAARAGRQRAEESENESAGDRPLNAGGHHHDHHASVPEMLSVVFVGALSFHSLFGGIVYGLQQDFAALLAIFLALIAHKWSEAFAMGSAIARDDKNISWRRVALLVACPPLSTLLGVATGAVVVIWAGEPHGLMSAATAVSAGLFLFIAILDVLEPEMKLSDTWTMLALKGALCLFGFGVAVMLNVLVHE